MVTHFFFCIYFKLSIGVLKLYISFFLTSYFWTLKMSSFKEISSLTGWPATSLLNPSKLLFSSSISKGKIYWKSYGLIFKKILSGWVLTSHLIFYFIYIFLTEIMIFIFMKILMISIIRAALRRAFKRVDLIWLNCCH